MKNLLREIRQQPEHIRSLFMWTFVVIVFSVVGFVWFRNTGEKFVALLNPEQAEARRVLARDLPKESPSLFANLRLTLGGFLANISELINIGGPANDFEVRNQLPESQGSLSPQELPLSGDK